MAVEIGVGIAGRSARARRLRQHPPQEVEVHRHHRPPRPVDRAGQAPVGDLALAEDVDGGAAAVVVDQHLAARRLAEIRLEPVQPQPAGAETDLEASNRLMRPPGANPGA